MMDFLPPCRRSGRMRRHSENCVVVRVTEEEGLEVPLSESLWALSGLPPTTLRSVMCCRRSCCQRRTRLGFKMKRVHLNAKAKYANISMVNAILTHSLDALR